MKKTSIIIFMIDLVRKEKKRSSHKWPSLCQNAKSMWMITVLFLCEYWLHHRVDREQITWLSLLLLENGDNFRTFLIGLMWKLGDNAYKAYMFSVAISCCYNSAMINGLCNSLLYCFIWETIFPKNNSRNHFTGPRVNA